MPPAESIRRGASLPGIGATQISLRPAVEADIPWLLDLWHESMSPHFLAAGVPAALEQPLHRLMVRFGCASIVLFHGDPAGMLKVSQDDLAWTLVQVMLSPEHRNKGVGSFLIRSLIAEARAHGATLSLSVLKENPAFALYQRLGFNIMAEEPHAHTMRLAP